MRFLYASIFLSGARGHEGVVLSRACRWARCPMLSVKNEQLGQPPSQLGSNRKR